MYTSVCLTAVTTSYLKSKSNNSNSNIILLLIFCQLLFSDSGSEDDNLMIPVLPGAFTGEMPDHDVDQVELDYLEDENPGEGYAKQFEDIT